MMQGIWNNWIDVLFSLSGWNVSSMKCCSIWLVSGVRLAASFSFILFGYIWLVCWVHFAASCSCTCFAILIFSCLASLALIGCATLSTGDWILFSLFILSVSLLGLFILFLTIFWPPSEIGGWGKNSLPPSVFIMGVAFRCGIISGVLFHVNLECTLGVVLTFAFVVGVEEVCRLPSGNPLYSHCRQRKCH